MATWRYEISLLLLKKYFTSECSERVKYFSTLEEKFRISAQPCDILYVSLNHFYFRFFFLHFACFFFLTFNTGWAEAPWRGSGFLLFWWPQFRYDHKHTVQVCSQLNTGAMLILACIFVESNANYFPFTMLQFWQIVGSWRLSVPWFKIQQ